MFFFMFFVSSVILLNTLAVSGDLNLERGSAWGITLLLHDYNYELLETVDYRCNICKE